MAGCSLRSLITAFRQNPDLAWQLLKAAAHYEVSIFDLMAFAGDTLVNYQKENCFESPMVGVE